MGNDDYFAWNGALQEEYFGPHVAGELVYLDSDAEAFEKACAKLGVSKEAGPRALAEAVRGGLHWRGSGLPTFGYFDTLVTKWARRRHRELRAGLHIACPPVVGLLMIFSMAAEHMGTNGSKTTDSEAGFYAQLERSLRVPADESQRMRKSFRTTSERYWEALKLWLEDADGEWGLPSAHTLTHRYVGLPISQALIRDTERRHLHNMFRDQGFAVGALVPHDEMLGAIDVWMNSSQAHPNSILRKMWTAHDTRAKITDAAVNELMSWDGSGDTSQSNGGTQGKEARCLLTLRERRRLTRRQYSVGVVLDRRVAFDTAAKVLLADGSTAAVALEPLGSSLMGISAAVEFDAVSLLEGDLRVEWQGKPGARRAPKRIAVFAQDAASASYVECDRLPSSTLSRILVKDENGLPQAVQAVLADSAASSYVKVIGLDAGIPDGWVLFSDVQLLRPPAAHLTAARSDLSCLEPRMSTQITIRGGMRLPGRILRWVAADGMEALVTADDETPVDVIWLRTNPETLEQIEETLARGVVPPAWLPIPAGDGVEDFKLSLRKGGTVLQELAVRLRSSDSPRDSNQPEYQSLCHDGTDALWPLRAKPAYQAAEIVVDGAAALGAPVDVRETPVPERPDWRERRVPRAEKRALQISSADGESCLVTGRHRIILPVASAKPLNKWMYGTCANCHTSKRYPTKAPRTNHQPRVPSSTPSRGELPPAPSFASDWSNLVDALTYLGRGTEQEFARLARQIEDSSVFVNQTLSALEALSTLEVERGPNLETVGWEMATSTAAELSDGSWMLTGHMPSSLSLEIALVIEELGGWHRIEGAQVKSTIVGGISQSLAESLFEEFGIEHAQEAGKRLAAVLPPLSSVLDALPREETRFGGELEFFELDSAQWRQINGPNVVGAYKVTSRFKSAYFFRDAADVTAGTWRRIPPALAKHASAMVMGRPIMRYDSAANVLSVPPGCELPGLYGRSAVLCSGQLPAFNREAYAMEYPEVDAESARLLVGKVMA